MGHGNHNLISASDRNEISEFRTIGKLWGGWPLLFIDTRNRAGRWASASREEHGAESLKWPGWLAKASPPVTADGVGIPGTFSLDPCPLIPCSRLFFLTPLCARDSRLRPGESHLEGRRTGRPGSDRTARLAPRHSTRLFDLCSRNCWFKRFCTLPVWLGQWEERSGGAG